MPLFGSSDVGGEGPAVSVSEATAARAKAVISRKLVEAVKDLQYEMGNETTDAVKANSPAAARLCHALEAALVHGVRAKDSLVNRLMRGRGTVDSWSANGGRRALPTANFWLFALYHSHQETMRRIQNLSQVRSNDASRLGAAVVNLGGLITNGVPSDICQ